MNNPISWDPSLVKKFSSSNHYKLLNQLRNEVIKYPLNNKRTSTSQTNSITLDNKNKLNISQTQISPIPNTPDQINESDSNKSNVSFNNAKNFSIYNHTINNNKFSRNQEIKLPDQSKSIDDSSSQSFKERLNQIDMK